jgi:hypothetical protein
MGFDDPKPVPLLLQRAKVCAMLQITKREFYALVDAGKLHPVNDQQKRVRVPLAEVISLKAELAHRALSLPYEKFVMAASFFSKNAVDVNQHLMTLEYPKAPYEYIERMKIQAQTHPSLEIIRAETLPDFFRTLGRAEEIVKRADLRLLVELLHMMNRGEKEIQEVIRAKYGREYAPGDILQFIQYFYNWRIMDPESVRFYSEFVMGREKLLKECAYRRADYFVYYALGIDFGGEIAELLERSCLGLLHKLSIFIDGYVYGDVAVSQRDLQTLADIVATLLGAAKSVREGKVPKSKQAGLAETLIPKAISRGEFFDREKAGHVGASP